LVEISFSEFSDPDSERTIDPPDFATMRISEEFFWYSLNAEGAGAQNPGIVFAIRSVGSHSKIAMTDEQVIAHLASVRFTAERGNKPDTDIAPGFFSLHT